MVLQSPYNVESNHLKIKMLHLPGITLKHSFYDYDMLRLLVKLKHVFICRHWLFPLCDYNCMTIWLHDYIYDYKLNGHFEKYDTCFVDLFLLASLLT
jgi:hypothetical protein